jgi:hypothetical protein
MLHLPMTAAITPEHTMKLFPLMKVILAGGKQAAATSRVKCLAAYGLECIRN